MKIRYLLLVLLAVSLFNFRMPTSQAYYAPEDDGKYTKLWQKVDSLEDKGLPQSALEIVEEIYAMAKKENNSDQIIKSFIYRMKFKHSREEDSFENLIEELLVETDNQPFPTKNIMHSMLGEMYFMYYQANTWRFQNRTETALFEPDDMKTWDLAKLADRAIKHYLVSLNDADKLKNTPVNVYKEILYVGDETRELRPTLYDFVAHRAIDFFINQQITLTQPADKFELREDFYFADAKTFVQQDIQTSDTLSLHFHGIRILQDLLSFRLSEDNTDALIDADLKRFDFVYANSVNEKKDSLYLSTLEKMEKKYGDNPMSAEVSLRIAQYYSSRAGKYNPLQPETFKYKNDNVTAYDICTRVIEKHPNSTGASKCGTLQCYITSKSLSFQSETVILPNQKAAIKIDYRNIDKVYLQVARVDYEKVRDLKRKLWGDQLIEELKKMSKEVYTKTIDLLVDKDYNSHSVEELLNGLPMGYYLVMVSNSENFSYSGYFLNYDLIFVSELSYVYRRNEKGHYDVTVLNRNTGQPMAGINAQVWYQEYNYKAQEYQWHKGDAYITNSEGYFEMKCSNNHSYYSVELELKGVPDQLVSNEMFYLYWSQYTPSKDYSITFFTDRAIYRPGQTVYFKGIMINTDGEESEIVKGYSVTVDLYDVNYQKVADLRVTTNEFGTFSGTFQLPTNLLNGQFHLQTGYGSKYFSVEEYKRPKFEVEMLPFEGNYRLNDKIIVKGKAKAFAGYSITDAMVTYRITREPRWYGWWYWYYPTSTMEIAHGKAVTDDNGEFTIDFTAIPDLSMEKSEYLAFNYKVIVDVTDINGETQSTSKSMTVGYRSMVLNLEIPENIELEKAPFTKDKGVKISSKNLNGEPVNAKGQIKIYSLKELAIPLRERLWGRPDKHQLNPEEWAKTYPGNVYADENELKNLEKDKEVLILPFDTEKEKQLLIKNFQTWKPGRYVAEIYSKDAFGQDVSAKTYFTVYSTKSTTMPINEPDWFAISNNYGEPGDVAKFVVGSADENVVVIYEVEHKNKITHKEWLKLSKEQKVIEIPIEEKHRGNFSVHFTFTKNNRLYQHDALIIVPRTDKMLDIEFSTFRDKLYPGQEEEWRLVIKGALGDKVAAEMLATLYDASLDQFRKNDWYYSIYRNYGIALSWQTANFNYTNAEIYQNNANAYCYYYYPRYDVMNWFGFSYWSNNYYYEKVYYKEDGAGVKRTARPMNAPSTGAISEIEEDLVVADEEAMPDFMAEEAKPSNGEKKDKNGGSGRTEEQQEPQEEVQIRTNLNETAFFFPHLQTDEEGNIVIKFTIPEALTKWKMMGFAHTQDLKYGFIENELVTQKDLMVMPNAPRFFRENDKIAFPVKISNISSGDLSGKVTLELLDGLTMKPIEGIYAEGESKEKPFTVAAEKSTVAIWNLTIPEGAQVIAYRVIAKTAKFSDGEEKPIPVMTNRMLVTETLPLPIRGKQTKEFKFTKLLESGSSSTLKHEKLTLEFTSNPAWYAIQALPYLMEYPYECSEQTFSRFYANSIASHIANSNPKIKRVFDSWKDTPGSEALLSNLEKNQELKAVLLEETPWVLEAQDEGERKRRVGLLFDLNRMADELGSALKKLQQEQTVNGGWPWFKGMPESWYITQHIVAGMGHLDKLGVKNVREDDKTWKMVEKAISFIDEEIREQYDWMKKHYTKAELEDNHLDYMAIHYMYGRSFFKDVKIPNRSQEAFDYFKGQEKKYWLSQSKYMQGMIALNLNRYEEQKTAKEIVASLKEHALFHEELGMYWKDNVGGYYWYQAPIETQALMVEVFHEVTDDKAAVEELKVWLIKQKQTQDWKTTKATVEACYALLLQGTDWLASDQLVEVKVAEEVIDPRKIPGVQIEAGTGYFKTSWSKTEVKPEMGKVTVTNPNEVVAWGALYWQYFEQLDKITPHETPLKLNKQLFKEIVTDRGKVIEPITKTDILQVGDKIIVRIELRVDRDMEYVHMKDMRASGFEPINVISRYKWQDGLGYYETTKDASTNFFMDYLRKGTYVFEYPLRVTHQGDFSNGITTIQCMYAPEFASHSEGLRVVVK